MPYEVVKELQIPEEAHHKAIPGEVLRVFGIAPDAPQSSLLLAQVAFSGINENGNWYISAYDAVDPPKEDDYNESDVFGDIAIRKEFTTPDEALEISEDWVRESEATVWVPGSTLVLDRTDTSISGVLLVRSTSVFNQVEQAQDSAPAPRGLRKLLSRR